METKIIKALSGSEIKKALLMDFERMLDGEGNLNAHVAYHSVAYSIQLQVRTPLNTPIGFDRVLEGTQGEPIEGETETFSTSVDQPETSPNGLREMSDQPIPVLVTDANGRSREEFVSYKGQPKKVGRPAKIKAIE